MLLKKFDSFFKPGIHGLRSVTEGIQMSLEVYFRGLYQMIELDEGLFLICPK